MALLTLANPDAAVARTNIDRAVEAVTEVSRDWRRWNAAVADVHDRVEAALPELRAIADRCR